MGFINANLVEIKNAKTGEKMQVPFGDLTKKYGYTEQQANFQRNMYLYGNSEPSFTQWIVEHLPTITATIGGIAGSALGPVGTGVGTGGGLFVGQQAKNLLEPAAGIKPQSEPVQAGVQEMIKAKRVGTNPTAAFISGYGSKPAPTSEVTDPLVTGVISGVSAYALDVFGQKVFKPLLNKITGNFMNPAAVSAMKQELYKPIEDIAVNSRATFEFDTLSDKLSTEALKNVGPGAAGDAQILLQKAEEGGYTTAIKTATGETVQQIDPKNLLKIRSLLDKKGGAEAFGIAKASAQSFANTITDLLHITIPELSDLDTAYSAFASIVQHSGNASGFANYGKRYLAMHLLWKLFTHI